MGNSHLSCAGRFSTKRCLIRCDLYTDRYAQLSVQSHKAYCKCGAYTAETHSMGSPNSSGIANCTKCGYGVQLWGDKPELEIE